MDQKDKTVEQESVNCIHASSCVGALSFRHAFRDDML